MSTRGATSSPWASVALPLLLLVVLALATAIVGLQAGSRAGAQDLEAQALQVERQLLCPRCTNVRLDHCELAICEDMRLEIRERLGAGHTSDDILLFFSSRFGDRVLADLPRSGFNLVLFGWVGGSIVFVLVAGSATLWRLRRTASLEVVRADSGALDAAEERWLDEQLQGSQGGGRG
ncbi:MAG: cytochrome c-type biogenesis protein CcmH [Chloroflexi bacterium]|nr:cytochrome c-type biogenesis protein CcmH [Chloroflexota bacterium]